MIILNWDFDVLSITFDENFMLCSLVDSMTYVRCTRRGLTKKIYAYVYIFRKAPSRTWRVREGALQKYMLTYMFFVRPLLEHGVYEKVPCAHACARLSCLSFRALLTSG